MNYRKFALSCLEPEVVIVGTSSDEIVKHRVTTVKVKKVTTGVFSVVDNRQNKVLQDLLREEKVKSIFLHTKLSYLCSNSNSYWQKQ
jgi:hypothetical protein